MTAKEARRALGEMVPKVGTKHAEEVERVLREAEEAAAASPPQALSVVARSATRYGRGQSARRPLRRRERHDQRRPLPAVPRAGGCARRGHRGRSTLVASSMASLRQHSLFERYRQLLSPAHREVVLSTVAGVWLPMDLARAHYEACEALGLSMQEQVGIGMEVSAKIHATLLGTVVRMARQAGVTPWLLLSRGHQMYSRLFQGGGGIRVPSTAPRRPAPTSAACRSSLLPYFRHAVRGIYHGGGLAVLPSRSTSTRSPWTPRRTAWR